MISFFFLLTDILELGFKLNLKSEPKQIRGRSSPRDYVRVICGGNFGIILFLPIVYVFPDRERWNRRDESERLLGTDGYYVPIHGCRKLAENKIKWKLFTAIKDVHTTKLDKTLSVNLFTVSFCLRCYTQVKRKPQWRRKKKVVDPDSYSYGTIHAANIVAWAHSKSGNSGKEWRTWPQSAESRSSAGLNVSQGSRITVVDWYPRDPNGLLGRHSRWWENEIVKRFGTIQERRVRSRMGWKLTVASFVKYIRQLGQ